MANDLAGVPHLFQDAVDRVALRIAGAVEAGIAHLASQCVDADLFACLVEIGRNSRPERSGDLYN